MIMDLEDWLVSAEMVAVPSNNTSSSSDFSPQFNTVSPADLELSRVPSSAPNSAAWSSLTSPLLDSPLDSFEPSPLFGTDDIGCSDTWEPLFSDAQNFDGTNMQVTLSSDGAFFNPIEAAANLKSDEALPLIASHPPHARRFSVDINNEDDTSSPSASPLIGGRPKVRHSTTNGVATSRKRSGPLPPIVVGDPSDIVAVKRARNTLAARKSRQRRVEKFDEMEKRIEELEMEVEHWKRLAQGQGA